MGGENARVDAGIDPELVGEWISDAGLGAVAPFEYRRIGDGKSNLVYRVVDATGSSWVLRRPPLGRLLPSAHDIGREYRILSRLDGTDVPIPRPVAFREPDAELDVPLLLMDDIAGTVIDSQATVAEVEVERRRSIGCSLARTLTRIHAVDLKAVRLDDLASHRPYAARQLKRWKRQFEDSKTRSLPLVDDLATRLEGAIPEQRMVTLVHGDYNLQNVITDSENGTVSAVLDWELCTLGDPLADLGGLLSSWPQADDPDPSIPTSLPSAPGFPSRAELIEVYVEASGRDVSDVAFWEALGCWKTAIILEGVLRRRLEEPENGDPADAAQLAERLLERGNTVAAGAGI